MPIIFDRAFTVDENGITLTDDQSNEIAHISASDDDPTIMGVDVPVGSLHVNVANGTLYIKTGVVDTDWSTSFKEGDEMKFANTLAFAARHG